MYWRHFDLSAEPFSLTPDPAFLYLSSVHAEAYAALTVGLRERRGLIAMIGEVGTGKTTLVYSLLSGLGPEIHTAYISNARLSFDGILRSALRDFGVDCDRVHVSELLDAFNRFLNRCAEDGTTAALVIDEAQNLSPDTFEDLRLLTNFETYKHKLLQIVLVGQPELDTKLRDPALRQVADRIAVRCHVNPLTPQEVRQYIRHRLAAAGGSIEIFSETALRILIRRSRGIPRSINVLGHNAMLFAYGAGRTRVTRADALAAIREREGRGLVRFESGPGRWFPWLARMRSSETSLFSYPRVLTIGLAVAAVAFVVTASIGTARRDAPSRQPAAESARAVTPPSNDRIRAHDTTSTDLAEHVAPVADSDSAPVRTEAVPIVSQLDAATVAVPAETAAPTAAPAPSPTTEPVRPDPRSNREASSTPEAPKVAVGEPVTSPDAPQVAAAEPVASPDTQQLAASEPVAPPNAAQIAAAEPLSSPVAPTATAQQGYPTLAPATAASDVEHATRPQPAKISASDPARAPTVAASRGSAPSVAATPKRKSDVKVARTRTAGQSAPRSTDASAPARISAAQPRVAPTQTSAAAGTPPESGSDARVIQVSPGSSLSNLITDMYGTDDPRRAPRIPAKNPQ